MHQELVNKMSTIRRYFLLNRQVSVTNTVIFKTCLDEFLSKISKTTPAVAKKPSTFQPNLYTPVSMVEDTQDLFVCSKTSVSRIIEAANQHGQNCIGQLSLVKPQRKRHVLVTKLRCNRRAQRHEFRWSSSPYLANGEYYINHKIHHSYAFSGMIPSHYERFCDGANIGQIPPTTRKSMIETLSGHVLAESEAVQRTAFLEEIYQEEMEVDDPVDKRYPIDIATDAQHGCRKNTKDTSVVALGEKTHHVVAIEHVTKVDDFITQRHERLGTERIYTRMEENGAYVNVHAHDANGAVNVFAEENAVTNQNDTWHGIKSLKKALQKVAAGPQYKKGIVWYEELSDKVEPVLTHVRHCLRNCDQDPDTLRKRILTCVDHYQNRHDGCSQEARCQRERGQYQPSTAYIYHQPAVQALRNVLSKSLIYKKAELYCLAKDTYYVESFNNVMNIFQDKRIAFTDAQYNLRSHLAVLHWNENVNREYTSIWRPRGENHRGRSKKNYKKLTFQYRENVWRRHLNAL